MINPNELNVYSIITACRLHRHTWLARTTREKDMCNCKESNTYFKALFLFARWEEMFKYKNQYIPT